MHNPATKDVRKQTDQSKHIIKDKFKKSDEQQDLGYSSMPMEIIECDRHLPSLQMSLQSLVEEMEPMEAVENAFSNMKLIKIVEPSVCESGSTFVCQRSEDIDLRQTYPSVHNRSGPTFNEGYRSSEVLFKQQHHRCLSDKMSKLNIVRLFQENEEGDNQLHLSIIDDRENDSLAIIDFVPEYDWLSFVNLMRQTPLHLAVLKRQARVVRRLICAGAFVTAQDNNGDSPLHIACNHGYEEIVRLLLIPVTYEETLANSCKTPFQRLPQDMSIRNSDGDTCLHLAAKAGHHHVVEMLLDAGANVNMGDGKSGRTLLHLAAESNDQKMVDLLLSRPDIDWSCRTYGDLTPAQLAHGRRHMSIVHRIFKHVEKHYNQTWRDFPCLEISEDEDDSGDEDNAERICSCSESP